jgi:hypothetical protein
MTAIAVRENVQFCAELVDTVLLLKFRLSSRVGELVVKSCLSAFFIVASYNVLGAYIIIIIVLVTDYYYYYVRCIRIFH